ncbi:excitatory amino acid transporter 1-like [Clinocottus analis]|uniref:excitatory amino acid transporter 1-like n=1 Tax=Clinocottus analis TaxID=304258 RepID=UPI0035C1972F
MIPNINDLELNAVEVTLPLDNPALLKCNKRSNVVAFLMRNAFVMATMAGIALGFGLGFSLRHINMSATDVKYLTFPGELLMRLLQMMVLPLIISSVIAGMSSVDKKAFGKIGLKAFSYYMVTTVIAAFTGIAVAVLMQPGKSSRTSSVPSRGNAEAVQTVDSILDVIRNINPSNLVEACFRKVRFDLCPSMHPSAPIDGTVLIPLPGTSDGVNVLGLLFFSVVFGLILGSMEDEAKPLKDFFDCLNKAIMRLVNMVIWYSPVGLVFLLAGQIVKVKDSGEIGRGIGMYTLTVATGILIHSLFTLPLIYFIITRKNPFRFMLGLLHVLTTAFGTSSSCATLPITLYCMEENHNMDKQVTRFMLPIGATMNMDGAALYEAVAALFIAQINDIEFGLGQIILLSLIVTVASTGAAGIPQAGMVTMILVLESAGLPTEDISLLMIVDWILDRLRTTTNVLGDCVGVSVVQRLHVRTCVADARFSENISQM